jgi:nitroreductase
MEVFVMDVMNAIYTRRSIRNYKNEPVSKEMVNKLLEAATMAPSGSNMQPWVFVVIQDVKTLQSYSDRAKALCLHWINDKPDPHDYKKIFTNPEFNLFYNAGTLVIIYRNTGITTGFGDCCLAAQNLMLAAHAHELGACWIGFSVALFDSMDFKKELGIPLTYQAVAPIIVGYPEASTVDFSRNPPSILAWK